MPIHSRIHFMAATSDLTGLMTAIEAQKPLKYTLTGFPDEPVLHQYSTFAKIESFGASKFGNMILDASFLVSEPDLEIKIRPVPQTRGRIKHRIYTELNSKTLVLRPGGLFQGDTVISGELMKYSVEIEAEEMFKIFRWEVKRQFKKHDSYPYWLGKEAAVMHASGHRLTDDVRSLFSLPLENTA